MINAPQEVLDALESGNVSYANLVSVNLGDAYDSGNDLVLHLTDHGHSISFGGNLYTPDNNLIELAGISRKASTGSDAVDIVFGITDENLIDAIHSERYINKPTSISRVIIENGNVLGDFSIPIRTAWGLSHSISGDLDDRSVTLTIDSVMGDLEGDNGWYAINASHHQRHPNDDIMKHGATVMTEEQQKKYTTNFSGVINQQIKPPSLPVIYGRRNAKLIPICMLKHRKTHTSYRHYFTTMIYVVSIGECQHLDIKNLKKSGDYFNFSHNVDPSVDGGGWSVRERTPTENLVSILDDPNLAFWRQAMDENELNRLTDMYGKGLTLLFVNNRNRDDWLSAPPELTMPVLGVKCYDPRGNPTQWTTNPALQYADYLRSTEYGAGKRGIDIDDDNLAAMADHFMSIPESVGNEGIDQIHTDIQIDTGEPIVDNMNIWMEGTRMFTSDYYGIFNLRVETISAVDWVINEDDLIGYPEFESGEFTDRINQLTYTVKQLVDDNSDGAPDGALIEVDVEATFPIEGSQTHLDWIAEDGGIQNFDSEELSYVTNLEQAYYWAMVDARASRQPRTLTLPVGVKGWLSEVGDIIQFTSEVMDETNTLWRVEEVNEEDEGEIELELKAYDANFYTPDPDAIPDPVAPAVPPLETGLSKVTAVTIYEDSGFYYITWVPLSSENVSWYAVEIYRKYYLDYDENGDPIGDPLWELVVDEPKVAQPPLILPKLIEGEYRAVITAVGVNDEGEAKVTIFTVQAPVAPTITLVVETFEVEVALSSPSNLLGATFELMLGTVNDVELADSKGVGSNFTLLNLIPDTVYYVFAKTMNIAGESEWASESFRTKDGQKYVDIIGDLPLVDLDPIYDELETIPRAWDEIVSTISGIFGEAIGGKERIVNTKAIEAESMTRQEQLLVLNDNLVLLEQELAALDDLFPIQSTSISNGAISTPKLAANAVLADKIASNNIFARHIIANAVSADKIAANAITSDKISANAITSDKIATNAIISNLIAANAIVASKIAAGAITADKIAANEITGEKIAAETITSDKLIANIVLGVDAVFQGNLQAASGFFKGTIETGGALGFRVNDSGLMECSLADISSLDSGNIDVTGSSANRLLYVLNSQSGGTGIQAQATGTFSEAINAFAYIGVKSSGSQADFYASNTGYLPFTGAHEGLIDSSYGNIEQGDIVVDVSVINIANISNAICMMELSSKPNQKSASGVLVSRIKLDANNMPAGLDDEPETALLALNHDLISFNALGEGAMNVCGEGGDIDIGDLITTSNIAGKGMKQLDQDNFKPYTVAQSRQKVTFDSPEQVKQIAVYYKCG